MYSLFPEHLSQEWSGYVIVRPQHLPIPLTPVVPNFYGLYAPDEATISDSGSGNAKPKLIMLMEECGKPIRLDKLSTCASWSHLLRLHIAGFVQGSFHTRNLLVQPGPLCLPPSQRTMKHPSYRIIDFGRGRAERDYADNWAFVLREKKEDQEQAMVSLSVEEADVLASLYLGGQARDVDEEDPLPLD
ncbi:hypothetical protein BOTBODRAFT_115974 [Botryobasidium botryosum FD-172 SS1]|uniref:Protein kinase domain-containing protein n=1 Tax=Botryobasidium botryosum (strain FD-172 SS1) TaxID=930990 RepID=A0A067M452_BOTB1|nr:hypothetical protein BOTBODRAFT_115974 [Botryobasidium botryosum FD-172 SS1]